MSPDVYRRLARHLDDLPGGFPPTDDGLELRLLQRLFSEAEAELALKLTLIPESAPVVARRAGIPVAEAETRLADLAAKGLAFSIHPTGKAALYMAAQYVIGVWEYHVNDLDKDLIRDMNNYIPHLVDISTWEKEPQLRTIPVGRSIDARTAVLAHERAEELIRAQNKFLVAPCICRREHAMVGKGCDKPEESCLVFGWGAEYYHRNGLGRLIDVDEAIEIVRRADKAGLVLQPSNAKKVVNICCCCGCCCQVLKNVKRQPAPAKVVSSPFTAALDREACTGCEVCLDRCQMDALTMADGRAELNPDRCIGCGLCVSTCPGKALTLVRKPEADQPDVPANMYDSTVRRAKVRGKLGPLKMATLALKSKFDRLMAAKE